MKKILFVLIAVCCIENATMAQELTKQMFSIYFGQPKTLVQSNNMTSETMIVEFDRSGRVLSKASGGAKMVYDWSSDEKSVEIKTYNNEQYAGGGTINIEVMSSNLYKFSTNGMDCEVSFRANGSINKMKMSGGGQTMSTTYYYRGSEDAYPYEIVTAGGGQSMSLSLSDISVDAKGNYTRCTQSAQGQSVITTNSISYY